MGKPCRGRTRNQAKDGSVRVRVHPSKSGFWAKPVYIRNLEGIKEELHRISERSNAVGYLENDVDAQAVCELAESVREAIIEYQVGLTSEPPQGCTAEAPPSWLNRKRCTSRTGK